MANPNYYLRSQFQYSNSAQAVALRAAISFGASGAPTIQSGTGMGISSIVRNSAGDYTITLSRPFVTLMGVKHNFISSAAPASPSLYVKANSVASSPSTVEIVLNNAGTATDPANGEVMLIEILLDASSVGH